MNAFKFRPSRWILIWLVLSLLGATGLLLAVPYLPATHVGGKVRVLFDHEDAGVYFQSAEWAVSDKVLYQNVFSEYPLPANVIFGVARKVGQAAEWFYVSHYLPQQLHNFSEFLGYMWAWMTLAWIAYLWIVWRVWQDWKHRIWFWLQPAALYFTFYRYDIYPAIACYLALWCIQEKKYAWGSLWLGGCLALKGYALFLLPAFGLFLQHQKGWKYASQMMGIALAPFVLSHIIIWLMAGTEGVVSPYQYHAVRGLNGETTFDALVYLWGLFSPQQQEALRVALDNSHWSRLFQILVLLGTIAMRPKTFEDLVNTFLVGVVGFISFNIFYSPQFVLWVIPIACFSQSKPVLWTTFTFGLATYFYFPLAFDSRYAGYPEVFPWSIILIAGLRIALMGMAVGNVMRVRRSGPQREPEG